MGAPAANPNPGSTTHELINFIFGFPHCLCRERVEASMAVVSKEFAGSFFLGDAS